MKIADVNLIDTFGNPYTDIVENVKNVYFENDFVVIPRREPDGTVNLAAYHKNRVISVHTHHVRRE